MRSGYTLQEQYEFHPYNHKIITPSLYGLDSFEIAKLSGDIKKSYTLHINRAFIRTTAAMIAGIFLFFFLSEPVENTYVGQDNQAELIPEQLFKNNKKQSILSQPSPTNDVPMALDTVEVKEQPATTVVAIASTDKVKADKAFHIIIASSIPLKDAEQIVEQLKAKGYNEAQLLTNDRKIRVSITHRQNETEAYRELQTIRSNSAYQNAWILKISQ